MTTLAEMYEQRVQEPLTSGSFPAIGTTATVITTKFSAFEAAIDILSSELGAMDLAASRFRPDSELVALNANAGRPVRVSALLYEAIETAVRAARITDGAVDPTVGGALQMVGYDRDFPEVDISGPPIRLNAVAIAGWSSIRLNREDGAVVIPKGVSIDLGATAKALCADRAASRISTETGSGVLVNLGGDISVAGPPPTGGWSIRIADHHGAPAASGSGPAVSIRGGGLSTSSTTVRRWIRGGTWLHHIIDPATGLPAREHWRTVSVAAENCVDANIASCAAIVLGDRAPQWLARRHLASRLVDPSSRVTVVAGWPEDRLPSVTDEDLSC